MNRFEENLRKSFWAVRKDIQELKEQLNEIAKEHEEMKGMIEGKKKAPLRKK